MIGKSVLYYLKKEKSLTNLERFMSRNPLITIVLSVSSGRDLFSDPNVLNTERIFRRPKS